MANDAVVPALILGGVALLVVEAFRDHDVMAAPYRFRVQPQQMPSTIIKRVTHEYPGFDVYHLDNGQVIGVNVEGRFDSADHDTGYCLYEDASMERALGCVAVMPWPSSPMVKDPPDPRALTPFLSKMSTRLEPDGSQSVNIAMNDGSSMLVTPHHVFVYATLGPDGFGDGNSVVGIMHRDDDRSECDPLHCDPVWVKDA